MTMTEAEELELLELEEEEAKAKAKKTDISKTPDKKTDTHISDNYGAIGALFPKTTEATEKGKGFLPRFGSALYDVTTAPGRVLTGAMRTTAGLQSGENFEQASKAGLQNISGENALHGGFGEEIARSPGALLPVGGAATVGKIGAEAVGGLLAKKELGALMKKGAVEGVKGSIPYAVPEFTKQASDEGVTLGNVAQLGGNIAAGGVLGGGLPMAGKVVSKATPKNLGELLKGGALKNIDVTLKPGHTGKKLGFLEENVVKHDLIGTPEQTYQKAKDKLSALQLRAQEIAENSPERFNVSDIFDNTIATLNPKNNPNAYKKQVEELIRAKENFVEAFGDEVNAADAMKIRSQIGKETAFVGRTSAGAKVDPDANWKENVYNDLYHKWKDELHNKLGGELKKINIAQSEIIPIKAVADRRNTITKQNNRISLADLGTTGIGAAAGGIGSLAQGDDKNSSAAKALALGVALAGARRGLGSAAATKAFYGLGSKLAPESSSLLGNIGQSVKRTLGNERGAVSDVDRIIPYTENYTYPYKTGEPTSVEVFHGTNKEFDKHAVEKLGTNTHAPSSKLGFFHAGSPELASIYAMPHRTYQYSEDAYRSMRDKVKKVTELQKTNMADKVYGEAYDILDEKQYIAEHSKTLRNADGSLFNVKMELQKLDEQLSKIDPESVSMAANAHKAYIKARRDALNAEILYSNKILPDKNIGANIRSEVVNFKNPYVYDNMGLEYRPNSYVDIIADAKKNGHDGVIIKNTQDPLHDNVFVSFHPSQITPRTNFNKIGTTAKHSGIKLLAGTSAAGLGALTGYGALQTRNNKK